MSNIFVVPLAMFKTTTFGRVFFCGAFTSTSPRYNRPTKNMFSSRLTAGSPERVEKEIPNLVSPSVSGSIR